MDRPLTPAPVTSPALATLKRARRGIFLVVASLVLLGLSLLLASARGDGRPAAPGTWPVLRGPYFGQKPPGPRAGMLAPGIVSTEHHEDGPPVFTPDGRECFWRVNGYRDGVDRTGVIFWSREVDGRWTEPRVAPFSSAHTQWGLCMQPDGRRLYFWSRRPRPDGRGGHDGGPWYVDRAPSGWSEARPLALPAGVGMFSVGTDGSLIYASRAPDGRPGIGVYRVRWTGDGFAAPEPMGVVPRRDGNDLCCSSFSSDGRTLVLTAGVEDRLILVASFRGPDGEWSTPVPLGEAINAGPHTKFAAFSTDGRYLLFASNRPASPANPPKLWKTDVFRGPQREPLCDAYWVDARAVEALRPATR